MFNNARHFNEVGSQIYCDANTLSALTNGFVRQAGNDMHNPRVMKERDGHVLFTNRKKLDHVLIP